jgi:hypothetical protein
MINGWTTLPENEEVICTLFEGHYHIGAAALINSIVRSGFRGLFWIGHRGALPPWTAQLVKTEQGLYQVGGALIGFEAIENAGHFTQFKPEFMSNIFERGIATKSLWYFDPDITVRCDWEFFQRWIRFGVGLCQEITMGTMPSNHPIRCEWMEAAHLSGWPEPHTVQERYYNGGFVALNIEHREFLETWSRAMKLANAAGVDPHKLQHGTRASTYFSTDQDALNIAAMYSRSPLTTIGPEAMGFVTGGFAMYHSVGSKKSWRKDFLRLALAGDPPWNGDKHFLERVDGPIRPYTQGELKKLRRSAKWATLIGRFYRRQ